MPNFICGFFLSAHSRVGFLRRFRKIIGAREFAATRCHPCGSRRIDPGTPAP